METKDTKVLSIILNGEKYLMPTQFANTSQLLSKYVNNPEMLFLYENKEHLDLFIKYYLENKEKFVYKIYNELHNGILSNKAGHLFTLLSFKDEMLILEEVAKTREYFTEKCNGLIDDLKVNINKHKFPDRLVV